MVLADGTQSYGNDVTTRYAYDSETFRLVQMHTQRVAAAYSDDARLESREWPGNDVQNLHYTYDPVGNIAHIGDNAQQTIYFRNRRVEPSADYIYDALYRLIEATDREHVGQNPNGSLRPPSRPSDSDQRRW